MTPSMVKARETSPDPLNVNVPGSGPENGSRDRQ